MWTLPRPETNTCKEEISAALTYADKSPVYAITEEQIEKILALYDVYKLGNGKPRADLVGTELGDDLLRAMYEAYGEVYDGRRLEGLRNRIKLGALKCPYCGFGEIKDLDHHLPRSVYKALSIFALNLVPACHTCNNKKRAVAGDTPNTQFFHTYLDTIAPVTFLYCAVQVSVKGFVVDFYLNKPAEIDGETFSRLQFQFARLGINQRLKAEVASFMASQRPAIEMSTTSGQLSLVQFLEKARDFSMEDFGKNHWQTALWAALASHDGFCSGGYIHAFGRRNPGA